MLFPPRLEHVAEQWVFSRVVLSYRFTDWWYSSYHGLTCIGRSFRYLIDVVKLGVQVYSIVVVVEEEHVSFSM